MPGGECLKPATKNIMWREWEESYSRFQDNRPCVGGEGLRYGKYHDHVGKEGWGSTTEKAQLDVGGGVRSDNNGNERRK